MCNYYNNYLKKNKNNYINTNYLKLVLEIYYTYIYTHTHTHTYTHYLAQNINILLLIKTLIIENIYNIYIYKNL